MNILIEKTQHGATYAFDGQVRAKHAVMFDAWDKDALEQSALAYFRDKFGKYNREPFTVTFKGEPSR